MSKLCITATNEKNTYTLCELMDEIRTFVRERGVPKILEISGITITDPIKKVDKFKSLGISIIIFANLMILRTSIYDFLYGQLFSSSTEILCLNAVGGMANYPIHFTASKIKSTANPSLLSLTIKSIGDLGDAELAFLTDLVTSCPKLSRLEVTDNTISPTFIGAIDRYVKAVEEHPSLQMVFHQESPMTLAGFELLSASPKFKVSHMTYLGEERHLKKRRV